MIATYRILPFAGLAAIVALVGASALPAGSPKNRDGAAFQQEAADLQKLPEQNCSHCYLLSAFGSVIPIPSRYVLVPGVNNEDRCILFRYPSDLFLFGHRKIDHKNMGFGSISLCRTQDMEGRIADIEKSTPPENILWEKIDDLDVQIKTWKRQVLSANNITVYRTYIRSDQEALMIVDSNPLLAQAVLDVAKRAAIVGLFGEGVEP